MGGGAPLRLKEIVLSVVFSARDATNGKKAVGGGNMHG